MNKLDKFAKNYIALAEAARLLDDDNLVWSDDLELIRKPLATWLVTESRTAQKADKNALKIAKLLTSGQEHIRIVSWLENARKG